VDKYYYNYSYNYSTLSPSASLLSTVGFPHSTSKLPFPPSFAPRLSLLHLFPHYTIHALSTVDTSSPAPSHFCPSFWLVPFDRSLSPPSRISTLPPLEADHHEIPYSNSVSARCNYSCCWCYWRERAGCCLVSPKILQLSLYPHCQNLPEHRGQHFTSFCDFQACDAQTGKTREMGPIFDFRG
jgi:hypothetical protein